MTVRNFLEFAKEFSNLYVKIFDNTRYDTVFDERDYILENFIIDEIDFHGFGDYEVVEFAIHNENGLFVLELDIEMEKEDLSNCELGNYDCETCFLNGGCIRQDENL